MRYHEIASGLRLPLSGEEQEVMNKVGLKGCTEEDLGDERTQEVARVLMVRGLLNKIDRNGKVVYRLNSIHNHWVNRDD